MYYIFVSEEIELQITCDIQLPDQSLDLCKLHEFYIETLNNSVVPTKKSMNKNETQKHSDVIFNNVLKSTYSLQKYMKNILKYFLFLAYYILLIILVFIILIMSNKVFIIDKWRIKYIYYIKTWNNIFDTNKNVIDNMQYILDYDNTKINEINNYPHIDIAAKTDRFNQTQQAYNEYYKWFTAKSISLLQIRLMINYFITFKIKHALDIFFFTREFFEQTIIIKHIIKYISKLNNFFIIKFGLDWILNYNIANNISTIIDNRLASLNIEINNCNNFIRDPANINDKVELVKNRLLKYLYNIFLIVLSLVNRLYLYVERDIQNIEKNKKITNEVVIDGKTVRFSYNKITISHVGNTSDLYVNWNLIFLMQVMNEKHLLKPDQQLKLDYNTISVNSSYNIIVSIIFDYLNKSILSVAYKNRIYSINKLLYIIIDYLYDGDKICNLKMPYISSRLYSTLNITEAFQRKIETINPIDLKYQNMLNGIFIDHNTINIRNEFKNFCINTVNSQV